ncbi:unnamed protein product [Urochloa humidicola]
MAEGRMQRRIETTQAASSKQQAKQGKFGVSSATALARTIVTKPWSTCSRNRSLSRARLAALWRSLNWMYFR